MAKTQHYEPTITLNAKAAENALEGLKVKASQVRQAMLEAGKIGDEKELKKLDSQLKSIESSQRALRKQTYDYNNVLKNLNTSSIKDLTKAATSLRNELKHLSPNTQEFIDKSKQLAQVRGRIDQLNGRIKDTHSWFSRAGATMSKYFGMLTAAIASFTGVTYAIKRTSEQAARMDDIYSDVMKTTGLLRNEVVWLNEEFAKFNTRTSREELNALARDAGKLGVSGKQDVLEFVRAANQINVALREDLGDDAIRNIGKLAEVFKITTSLGIEKSFLSIGSAINALGQASTANEGYLVDFTQRLAGAAYQSGMSVQNVLGFAAALDQTGQKVEMSATAFQKFLMKMFSDTATFAKMANMEVSEFSELLRTDVNEAVVTVLTALNNKGGFSALVPIFQDMGLDGARAVGVLTSLATNINLVREAQALSNREFALATSLTQEYNTKNENRQALLEKAKKEFQDQVILLGERLYPAYIKATNAGVLFMKFITSINKELVYAALVFAGAVVAVKSWNAVLSLGNTIMTVFRLVSLSLAGAMATVQGNTVRAAAAWKLFNASFSATAIGAIVTAVAALGYGIYKLITYQSDLTKKTKEFYVETEKAKKEAADLLSILESSEKGSDLYKSAIEKLTEKYGPYINHLIDEKGYLTDIGSARKIINDEIIRTIALKLKEEAINNAVSKSLGKQSDYSESMVQSMIKQLGISEDAARLRTRDFINAIQQGETYEKAILRVGGLMSWYFGNNPFRRYAQEYANMITEIKNINDQAELWGQQPEPLGPPVPKGFETEAQKKARLEKEAAAKKAEQEAELVRIKAAAEARAKLREQQFTAELEALDRQERERQVHLKKLLHESATTKEQYEALMQETTLQYLMRRNSLYLEYGKDNTSIQSSYYDELIKLADKANKKLTESTNIVQKWIDAVKKQKDEVEENPGDNEIIEYWIGLKKKADDIIEDLQGKSWKNYKKKELQELKDMLEAKLITQEQYEERVREIRVTKAEMITQQINELVNATAEFSNTLQEAQYSKLEREKEQELALHGDSADARAEIEQKYEQKKLEMQQQYADMDMGMKIAQAISSGAVAVATALSQLGAFAAPAIALITATTAMQVATIVAQRNAIKNSTTSSSAGSANTRTVNEYATGGYTERANNDTKAVGVVHANEWVAPAAMVRANPLVFASLEQQRVNRYSIHSPAKQFASGGFTTTQKSDNTDIIIALQSMAAEIRALKSIPFKSYVVMSELNATKELSDRIKQEGSL